MKNTFKLYFDCRKDAQIFMLALPNHYVSPKKDFILHTEYRMDLYKRQLDVTSVLTETEFNNNFS